MIRFQLNEGNKELNNRIFPVPKGIRKHLLSTLKNYNGDKTVDGYKRLNNLVNMTDGISYLEMKRLKNFFDNYVGTEKSTQFILNGGDKMKFWVNATLDKATKAVRDHKKALSTVKDNAFINTHEKFRAKIKPTKTKFDTKEVSDKMMKGDSIKFESKKRIFITKDQERSLLKEAQNDTFSFEMLESINSFKGRYQYCLQNLGPTIGRGSSRVIFQLSDEKCLKLALNGKGIAQNEQECLTRYDSNLFPEVFDNDSEYKYVVTEYVLPAKESDFMHCLGLSFKDFCKFIASSAYYRHGQLKYRFRFKEEDYVRLLETNEDLCEWDEYIGNDYTIGFGDMMRIANYGMTKRNGYDTIVLLDHGLNTEIFNKFYKRW